MTRAGEETGATLAFRACVLVVCVFAIYFALRQAVAAWYFRDDLPQGVETAAKWDPANPQYADTLANLLHFYSENPDPNRIVALCETATRLSPNDAHYWADLGSAYDWAGRPQDAIRAFERARELFPNSPDINWRLANFYARANRAMQALPLLRNVLLAGGVQDKQAFLLVSRTGVSSEAVMTKMLPSRASAFVGYLNFELDAGNVRDADNVWAGLLKSGLPFKIEDPFFYIDALIRGRNTAAAAAVWRELAARFPEEIRSRTSPPNLITNGNFDFPILNGGFDWRVNPVAGTTVRINSTGRRDGGGSLQLDFDGTRNITYGDTFEFVQVRPNTPYEFSAELRSQGITTESGCRFQIYDQQEMPRLFLTTRNVTGDSDWTKQDISFQTGPSTNLIVVQIVRPASQKFDSKIAGRLFVRHVSLREESER
jgi:Tetratricopeptide repeat